MLLWPKAEILDLFFLCPDYIGDLTHLMLKFHPYIDNHQIYVFGPDLSPDSRIIYPADYLTIPLRYLNC